MICLVLSHEYCRAQHRGKNETMMRIIKNHDNKTYKIKIVIIIVITIILIIIRRIIMMI
jgi:hypothetical protein